MGATSFAKYSCRVQDSGFLSCPAWLEAVGSLSVFLYATFGAVITVVVGYTTSLAIWPNTAKQREAQARLHFSCSSGLSSGQDASQMDNKNTNPQGLHGEGDLQTKLLAATS